MSYKLFHFFFTLCIGHCNFLCKKKDDSDQEEEDEVVVRPLEAETISFSFIGQVFYTMASIFLQDQHSTTMRPF